MSGEHEPLKSRFRKLLRRCAALVEENDRLRRIIAYASGCNVDDLDSLDEIERACEAGEWPPYHHDYDLQAERAARAKAEHERDAARKEAERLRRLAYDSPLP